MFYESLIILNISTLNFSEGVPASVVSGMYLRIFPGLKTCWTWCTFNLETLSNVLYLVSNLEATPEDVL